MGQASLKSLAFNVLMRDKQRDKQRDKTPHFVPLLSHPKK